VKVSLTSIRHNRAGFEALVNLYEQTKDARLLKIEIDFSHTAWFDADMCAAFGALLYRLNDGLNTVRLINIPPNVAQILSKNGFLSNYGGEKIPDTWGTTIPYRRFEVKDDRYFVQYIEDELVHRQEMPKMSPGLLKKFRESIFEIFNNSVTHSQTKLGIFSCGQFYPKGNRLVFSITDLGIGIQKTVQKSTRLNLSAEKAIVWATEASNTTKRGRIPGGLGLKLLREFIELNGGCIQIVSDLGYWQHEKDQASIALLSHPFPGTVVTIEIDTSDKHSYALGTEISEMDIF
jgi:Histidine kinase-, DNA gyrase B-, and HSP90-like ATPase